ncbi:MAG: ribosome maturation factor RimP, partial [Pseudomonadota bacterium]
IKGEYHLEVSSPGIDRPLTRPGDFANWVGHEARVEIGMPIDGRRRFHGWIAGEANAVAFLKLKDGGEAEIPIIEMVKAHLVLTDELIEDAQSRGQALDAPEDDSDEYDEVEVETDPVDAPAEEGEKT